MRVCEPPWGLIADDLSGACDSAVAFASHGFSASVLLHRAELANAAADVIAYSTGTRTASERDARGKVVRICQLFLQRDIPVLFKKTDSTLRGPYAVELVAAMQTLGIGKAFLNPAFPEQGRVVRNQQVFVIDANGKSRPGARIQDLPHVESCDAATRDDLDSIARRLLASAELPLICGSGGLALSIAAELAQRLGRRGPPATSPELPFGAPLLLIGTEHATTRGQVDYLLSHRLADVKALASLANYEGRQPVLAGIDWSAAPDLRSLKDAIRSRRFGVLILSGGDTARAVLDALNAQRIDLAGQIGPGLPWGSIHGGVADGRLISVKSGGFGDAATLEVILRHFSPRG